MRYLSVCSGIEAATVAWHPLGWEPVAFSEIEPFPRAVLQHHYPAVPLRGDFTALRDEPWIVNADILVGGTPCQAFSVAGRRQSLADDRGNLTLEFVRLADAIDTVRLHAGRRAAIVVWENVPGVLNTRDNAFGCFLAGLAGETVPLEQPGRKWANAGYVAGPTRTVAWRVLDAQYFGLAQRRRRVFVVASARNDIDTRAVLFERESVRRDTPPRREAGKVAPTIPSRSSAGGGLGTDFDCDGGLILAAYGRNNTAGYIDTAGALTAKGGSGRMDFETETFVCHGTHPNALRAGMGVRRLTPVECERLQGFPDGYTAIPTAKVRRIEADELAYIRKHFPDMPEGEARRLAADGPRYKALGNSMAVPVMAWIGQRIAAVEQITAAGGYLDSLEESPDVGDYEHDRRHWAHALDAVRREVLEEVLRTIAAEREAFKDPAYAGGPNGSFNEIFACNEIERAIRAIMDKEPSR